MKKARKKGLNPVVAVLFLVVSGGIAAHQLLGGGSLGARLPALVGGGGDPTAMPPDENAVADASATPQIPWRDLLAVHGSFDRRTAVRRAFSLLADVASTTAAAPGGESQPVETGRWTGADPPSLQLGVVMLSESSRRAVLGGRVVGVGDVVSDGRITAIERGTVTVKWASRTLTYDLDGPFPREFRAEQQRRAGANQDQAPVTGSKTNQENGK